jgi:hypothetical protein
MICIEDTMVQIATDGNPSSCMNLEAEDAINLV